LDAILEEIYDSVRDQWGMMADLLLIIILLVVVATPIANGMMMILNALSWIKFTLQLLNLPLEIPFFPL
jgi:hypothetical protein